MPLTLTEPLVTSVYSHEIIRIDINLEENRHYVHVADFDANSNEIGRRILEISIFDDLGVIIVPSLWPVENPTGEQLYALIKQFIYLGLQEQAGENGLGPGVIT